MPSGLGNGCDSCATTPYMNDGNMGMGQFNSSWDSQMNNIMANPYANQSTNMVSPQMQSFNATAGYPSNGGGAGAVPNMGMGSQYNPQQQANKAVAQAAQAASKLVAATAAAAAAGAAAANQQQASETAPEAYSDIDVSRVHPASIEGFDSPKTLKEHLMCVLVLFLVIIAALGMNEFVKFMINKSIQTADGTPYYYVLYGCGALLLGLITVRYARDW
jgi:hypothetical protein